MPTLQFTLPSGGASIPAGRVKNSLMDIMDQLRMDHKIDYTHRVGYFRLYITVSEQDLVIMSLAWERYQDRWHPNFERYYRWVLV